MDQVAVFEVHDPISEYLDGDTDVVPFQFGRLLIATIVVELVNLVLFFMLAC